MKLLDNMPTSKENAISLGKLCDLVHASPSDTKAGIRRLRLDGVPIISDVRGYWMTDSDDEKRDFIRRLEADAAARKETADAIAATLGALTP